MRSVSLSKTMRWGAPLLLLAVVFGHEQQVLAAATVQWSDFEKVESCYFAPSLSAPERAAVHSGWADARQRIGRLYGVLRSQPKIIVADAETYPRFATGTTGVTHYLATGDAITILGPPGHNVDVIAHELAHAELLARIGFRAITWCVPTWFDEGLAVQFDERPAFTEPVYFDRMKSGWHMPPLSQLDTEAKFFAGTRDEVRFHYAGARVAVGQWLRSMSVAEARRSIESIDCGEAWKTRLRQIANSLPAGSTAARHAAP
jgi:hypothetical protein